MEGEPAEIMSRTLTGEVVSQSSTRKSDDALSCSVSSSQTISALVSRSQICLKLWISSNYGCILDYWNSKVKTKRTNEVFP